jgi:hypothetical protein
MYYSVINVANVVADIDKATGIVREVLPTANQNLCPRKVSFPKSKRQLYTHREVLPVANSIQFCFKHFITGKLLIIEKTRYFLKKIVFTIERTTNFYASLYSLSFLSGEKSFDTVSFQFFPSALPLGMGFANAGFFLTQRGQ